MKVLIWSAFGLLALLWTGGALAITGALQWATGLVASGEAIELGKTVATWPVPAWANFWFDAAEIQAAIDGMVWALDSLRDAGPWMSSALSWLVPVTWVLWGLGLVVLLMLAALGQWTVRRYGTPTALPQPAVN